MSCLETLEGRIRVSYRWTLGAQAERFFRALREEKKILGTRCPTCGGVQVPPAPVCGKCFAAMDGWVEVGPAGQVVASAHYVLEFPGQPRKPPFDMGQILLDGASTPLQHLLVDCGEKGAPAGLRVEPVWREDRTGSLDDILHFRPLQNSR